MKNLFIVHTPFQLLVAQQLVNAEHLNDNILICSCWGSNKQFYDIFGLTIIEKFWSEVNYIDNLPEWAILGIRHLFGSILKANDMYKSVRRLIEDKDIGSVYLGDINNSSYQLLSRILMRDGIKVNFFEEGTSHYSNTPRRTGGKHPYLHAILSDLFFHIPYFHCIYGWHFYVKSINYNKIDFYKRYSIRAVYNSEKDVRLTTTKLISDKLADYINKEKEGIDGDENILLLTQPLYMLTNSSPSLIADVIRTKIKTLASNTKIFVKFHPAETDEAKRCIIGVLKDSNINYVVLGQKYNIPAEYYMQYIKFKYVLCFSSSTAFYNGYIYDYTPYVSLMQEYYNKCTEMKVKDVHLLDRILNLSKEIN